MARLKGADAARLFVDLIDYPADRSVRELFLLIVLELGAMPEIILAPEEHGIMSSLGVYRALDWCYSIKPTKNWVTVWLRAPEIRLFPQKSEAFVARFPDAGMPDTGALTTRLISQEQALAFIDLVLKD
jgi:hypothetical protein